MSQYAAELCNLLVIDHFGELYSLIFSYLLHHGRQPLPRIVNNTHLSPRQARHGLAVLIQQHLAYHYTSLDDGITYYEANWRGAYYLVRSGKILELIEDRLGKYAATVVSTILYLGHAKVGYLETLPELQSYPRPKAAKLAKTNGVNGVHDNEVDEMEDHDGLGDEGPTMNGDHDVSDSSQLHATLRALAAYGYISRVKDSHFQSRSDIYEDAERVVRSRLDSSLKGKKLQEALDEGIEKFVNEKTDGTIMRTHIPTGFHRGIKRREGNTDGDAPRKRVKLNDTFSYEGEDEDDIDDDDYVDNVEPMDENLVVRINYEKLDVALRNKRLVEAAEHSTMEVTAKVYEKLLTRIEVKTPQCRQQLEPVPEGEEGEHYSASVPLHTVMQDLDPALDLSSSVAGLADSPAANGNVDFDDEEDDGGAEDEEQENNKSGRSRIYEVGQHLSLLAQEPWIFSTKHGHSDMPTWVVGFRHLARKLRHLELERMIESRFGSIAVRIIRVLSAKGKLDEKRLQEISLMPTKDLRQILGHMEAAGYVDLQEVPRDTQRQPSRTMYLWFFDPDRVAAMVVEDTYKAMARCLQRISFERDKLKHFLEKTERTDVKGNEEKYLSEGELKTLQEWRDTEAMLLGEVGRLDDVVAVLRDF